MEVRDGERHIYANLDSCISASEDPRDSGTSRKALSCRPKVLINTQLKNRACLNTKKTTNKKDVTNRPGRTDKISTVQTSCDRGGAVKSDSPPLYNKPEIHSTHHVASALAQAKQSQPDVARLMKDKLDSPTTNTRLKKQPSKKVNVPKSQTVFKELVSLDVSEGALETQFRNTLNIRGDRARRAPGRPDPVPQQSDVFDPEEYVTRAYATKANCNYTPSACVQPQTLTKKDLHNFSKIIMNTF